MSGLNIGVARQTTLAQWDHMIYVEGCTRNGPPADATDAFMHVIQYITIDILDKGFMLTSTPTF